MNNSIRGFFGEYRFLSNFYVFPFEFNGLFYYTAEAAFQAQKCSSFEGRLKYTHIKDPFVAKKLGRLEVLPEGWGLKSYLWMKEVVRAKFSNKELGPLLLLTEDAYLEETNSWHDNQWGSCICEKCVNRVGENRLGIILMDVRSELKNCSFS